MPRESRRRKPQKKDAFWVKVQDRLEGRGGKRNPLIDHAVQVANHGRGGFKYFAGEEKYKPTTNTYF